MLIDPHPVLCGHYISINLLYDAENQESLTKKEFHEVTLPLCLVICILHIVRPNATPPTSALFCEGILRSPSAAHAWIYL